jgi:hypothetical protein
MGAPPSTAVSKRTFLFLVTMGTFTLVIGLFLHEELAGQDLDFFGWLILVAAYLLAGFFIRLWVFKSIDNEGRWK